MLFKRAKMKREEEMRKMKADAAKKAGLAFIAGSAIATVVTLFTTPKSGKEMREDVAQKVENGTDKIKETGEFLVVKTAEVMDATVEKGKRFKEKITSKFDGKCCDCDCEEETILIEVADENLEETVPTSEAPETEEETKEY